MTTRRTSWGVSAITLAAALALPLAAHARAADCPADTRLASSMRATLQQSIPITSQQAQLLVQMFSLQSAKRPVPAQVVEGLRSRTAKNARILASGERALRALPPGTPAGRTFKTLGLRYLHDAVRPMNACLGKAVEAKTVAEIGAAVTCFDDGKRRSAALERSIFATLTKLGRAGRCTLGG